MKKAYLQISKYLAQFFCLFPFSNIKKRILTSLKKPDTIFDYPLFKILKKHPYKSQNTQHNFLLILFSNIKKAYLRISKDLAQFFCLFHFSNFEKRILTNPSTIFYLFIFQILKKHTYKSQHSFLLIPFSNIKKAYLQISKYLAQFFCLFPFFKY